MLGVSGSGGEGSCCQHTDCLRPLETKRTPGTGSTGTAKHTKTLATSFRRVEEEEEGGGEVKGPGCHPLISRQGVVQNRRRRGSQKAVDEAIPGSQRASIVVQGLARYK